MYKFDYKNIVIEIRFEKFRQAGLHTKISCILSIVLMLLWLFCGKSQLLYSEGILEWFTACCLFFASILIFASNKKNDAAKKTRIYLYLICAFFFVLSMEEISWGQTIFHWNTPALLMEVNYQNETNIHNMFNPMLTSIYAILCLALGYLLTFTDEVTKVLGGIELLKDMVTLLPSAEFTFFGLVFLLLVILNVTHVDAGELTEEIFSVFSVAYAIEIYRKSTGAS